MKFNSLEQLNQLKDRFKNEEELPPPSQNLPVSSEHKTQSQITVEENVIENKEKLKKYFFFLGGEDLEMSTIKTLLDSQKMPYLQTATGWGAKATEFEEEIKTKIAEGYIPVKIELTGNIEDAESLIDVDHHNEQSSSPASILQVCELLGIQPDRKVQLIAANDVGFSHGMLKFGATREEISGIRWEDRRAQGISELEEQTAREAYLDMQIEQFEKIKLGIVDNIPYTKFAPVSDQVFTSGKVDCLVCIHRGDDHEIQLEWVPQLCRELGEKYPYPQSWSGQQYWGSNKLDPDQIKAEILEWLKNNASGVEVSQPSPRSLVEGKNIYQIYDDNHRRGNKQVIASSPEEAERMAADKKLDYKYTVSFYQTLEDSIAKDDENMRSSKWTKDTWRREWEEHRKRQNSKGDIGWWDSRYTD